MTKEGAADLKADALQFHSTPRPGKLAVVATKPLANQRDLALAYSPGVAFPCGRSLPTPAPPRSTPRARIWSRSSAMAQRFSVLAISARLPASR